MTTISPRQEEILSYLCGLAPIGEPLQVKHKWLETDFTNMHHTNFCLLIRCLIKKGAIEIVVKGTGSTPSVLRVLKRPEDFIFKDIAPRRPARLVKYAGYAEAA